MIGERGRGDLLNGSQKWSSITFFKEEVTRVNLEFRDRILSEII
jgi:hypothetical protein